MNIIKRKINKFQLLAASHPNFLDSLAVFLESERTIGVCTPRSARWWRDIDRIGVGDVLRARTRLHAPRARSARRRRIYRGRERKSRGVQPPRAPDSQRAAIDAAGFHITHTG